MEQFRGKYLVQNRSTGEIFETPQVAYMMIAATLFSKYPEETRLQYVKAYYDAISTFKLVYLRLLWLVLGHRKDSLVVVC